MDFPETFKKMLVYLFIGERDTGVPWRVCGGQRTIWGSQVSPSAMWVLGIKLQLSGLVASALSAEPSPQLPSTIFFFLSSFQYMFY